MGGLFGNLVQASKALMANQVAIQVTGRNLANVNNPEYSRQRVKMGDRYVDQTPHGPEGSGVEVLQVQQLRDAFLDAQVIRHASDTGSLDAQRTILSNLELVLGNPLNSAADPASISDTAKSPTGIGAALDDFFNAFSTLAGNPTDIPSKSAALYAASTLADRLNLADQRVGAAQLDQEGQIQADVQTANGLLADIAQLNFQIRQAADVETGGAVQLVDDRQAKLEKLAGLFKLDITKDPSNASELNISIGGVALVSQAQLVHQLGYLTQKAAADLSASGSLGNRTQGFEVGDYDTTGAFTPTVASTGGAAALRASDVVSGTGFLPTTAIVVAKLDDSNVQLNVPATQTGYFGLTINGVANARIAYATKDSKVLSLSNVAGYQVVPTGGSAQGRYQAVFGNSTATYLTAKGVRAQLSDLASAVRSQVNSIYNPGGTASDLFVTADVSLAGAASTTVAGSRNVNVADTTGLSVGMHVYGAGIPSGATVAKIESSTKFALSVPATADGSSVSMKALGNLLDVDPSVTASSLLTAPAGSPASANTFALRIAALRDSSLSWNSVVAGGAASGGTFSDYSRGMVTSLAQTIQTVGTRADEAQVVGDAIKAQRDSVSGVSLDEETSDLMRFQKAYQANAKVISVIDDMLSSLINMVR
jgi:flagellar hook-associated protein FlgK